MFKIQTMVRTKSLQNRSRKNRRQSKSSRQNRNQSRRNNRRQSKQNRRMRGGGKCVPKDNDTICLTYNTGITKGKSGSATQCLNNSNCYLQCEEVEKYNKTAMVGVNEFPCQGGKNSRRNKKSRNNRRRN